MNYATTNCHVTNCYRLQGRKSLEYPREPTLSQAHGCIRQCACPKHQTSVALRAMKKSKVMIVEDDMIVAALISFHLQEAGFECKVAIGQEALTNILCARYPNGVPDIFIIDYQLGSTINGLTLCKNIKATLRKPVMILTSDTAETTAVTFINADADHFLTKPYSPAHLTALARALIRRNTQKPAEKTTSNAERHDRLKLDPSMRLLHYSSRTSKLTEKEAALLEVMTANVGIRLSREMLHNTVYGCDEPEQTRRLDVLVGRARKKLKSVQAPYSIEYLRSYGYIFTTFGPTNV